MSIKKNVSEWWRRWFGSPGNEYYRVLDILRSRDAEEKQHAERFMQHAQRIEYPQFREELLRIAADESKHADWLAEKITQSGGSLPPVLQTFPTKRNSWQYLLDDLEEEQKCSGDLETAMLTIESDYPEVVKWEISSRV